MTFDDLLSAYRGYKHDGNIAGTWLLAQATKHGYSKPKSSAVLSGSKKVAQIPVNELIIQAEQIKRAEPNIKVPEWVGRALWRAVRGRRRYTAFFSQLVDRDIDADSRHNHFADVLEQIADILSIPPPIPKTAEVGSDIRQDGPSNYFDSLPTYEEEVAVYSDTNMEDNIYKRKVFIVEPELSAEDEKRMSTYYFFEDIHRKGSYLYEKMKDLFAGNLTAEQYAFLGNAAIEMVRKQEQDLLDSPVDDTLSYWRTAGIINPRRSSMPTAGVSSGNKEDANFLIKFLYTPTATALMRLGQSCRKSPHFPLYIPQPSEKDIATFPEYWQESYQTLANYMMDLKLECEHRAGTAQGDSDDNEVKINPYNLDGITKALTFVLNSEEPIACWMVFAVEMLFDFVVLSNEYRYTNQYDVELQLLAQDMLDSVQNISKSEEAVHPNEKTVAHDLHNCIEWALFWPVPSLRYIHTRQYANGTLLQGYHQTLYQYLEDSDMNMVDEKIKAMENKAGRPYPEVGASPDQIERYSAKFLLPLKHSRLLRRQNPLLCGTLMLELRIKYEQFGMQFANSYAQITATAHLYNALRQTGYLNQQWQEMENIMVHHVKEIFKGERPKDPLAIYNRAWLVAGASPHFVSESHRINKTGRRPARFNKQYNKDSPSWDLLISPLGQILQDWFNGVVAFDQVLGRIEPLMAQEPSSTRTQGSQQKRDMTSLKFLEDFLSFLPILDNSFKIDYVTMLRTCNALLRQIDEVINESVYDHEKRPNWHWKEPSITGYATVLNILTELEIALNRYQGKGKKKAVEVPTPESDIAAKILDQYISDGAVGVPGDAGKSIGLVPFSKGVIPDRRSKVSETKADPGSNIGLSIREKQKRK